MDFLKKNIVVKLPDEEAKMYLQSELEKDSFLPKQVNKDNGVIPYQVHKYELKKILDNLGDKIPFLKENANLRGQSEKVLRKSIRGILKM